jgi:hypothetical protein
MLRQPSRCTRARVSRERRPARHQRRLNLLAKVTGRSLKRSRPMSHLLTAGDRHATPNSRSKDRFDCSRPDTGTGSRTSAASSSATCSSHDGGTTSAPAAYAADTNAVRSARYWRSIRSTISTYARSQTSLRRNEPPEPPAPRAAPTAGRGGHSTAPKPERRAATRTSAALARAHPTRRRAAR